MKDGNVFHSTDFIAKERKDNMKHHQVAGAVVKGLAAGAVVGTAAYMIAGNSKKKTASMIKKKRRSCLFRKFRSFWKSIQNARMISDT